MKANNENFTETTQSCNYVSNNFEDEETGIFGWCSEDYAFMIGITAIGQLNVTEVEVFRFLRELTYCFVFPFLFAPSIKKKA